MPALMCSKTNFVFSKPDKWWYKRGCDLGFKVIVLCNTPLTLWSRVLPEKLIVSQPIKKFSMFLKPGVLFLFSQEPTTGLHP
jgi:hypothetical protein